MAGQTGYGHRGRFADGAVATRHGPDSSTRTPPGSLPHPVTTQHARCSTLPSDLVRLFSTIVGESYYTLPLAIAGGQNAAPYRQFRQHDEFHLAATPRSVR